MKKRSFLPFLLAVVAVVAVSCKDRDSRVELSGKAQGTYYSIIYYGHKDYQPQIDSILDAFDQSASLWVENSLLRQLNSNVTDSLDDILAEMFARSAEINEYTGGAFDCTIGKLVRAWGFGFDKSSEMTDNLIDSLRQYTGQGIVEVTEGNRLQKRYPETEIDFNAIAQGYVVDIIADFLTREGVESFLVDVGGEVIARGVKPDGSSWGVGIERPAADKDSPQEVELVINLDDMSVVTSGNYRKYYEKEGVKYSHTIDPMTGRPVEHSLLSVSVVDKYAWRADALATAFMVMGLEKSLQFIDSHPDDPQVHAVLFIYDDNGEMRTFATHEFEKIIRK